MSNDILAHREGGILTLTFNRLDKKNAITTVMYTRLAEELEQAAEGACRNKADFRCKRSRGLSIMDS